MLYLCIEILIYNMIGLTILGLIGIIGILVINLFFIKPDNSQV